MSKQEEKMNNKEGEKIYDRLDPQNPSPVCPVKDVLAVMFDKWSLMIVLALGKDKVLRFADLRRNVVGISPKMLTKSLRTLERDGHVVRTVYPEVPVKVEYHLTEQGQDFLGKVADLAEWIIPYMPTIVKNRDDFDKTNSSNKA